MTAPMRIAGTSLGGMCLVMICAFGLVDAQLDRLTLWLVQSLLALSLVVVWGRAGIFSLGQSALYGVGAYAFGMAAINLRDEPYLPTALLVATGATVFVAALIGVLIFYGNVSELNVAIITLALTLATYAILNNLANPRFAIGNAKFGGYNGLIGIPLLRFGDASTSPISPQHIFILMGLTVVLITSLVAALLAAPFGRVLAAVRCNPRRAELLGYDVRKLRLLGFTLGGALAGLAGALFAATSSYASPGLFTLQPAILVIIWVLVGGRSHVLAGVVGTLVVQGLSSWLGGSQGQYSPIYLGAALILIVLIAPQGLLGGWQVLWLRFAPRAPIEKIAAPATKPAPAAAASSTVPLLRGQDVHLRKLSKSFGGFTAVDGVDLDFTSSGIHCLIGPNGAGKSTLFALLVGTIRPTGGRITMGYNDIDKLLPHQRARRGVGIKMQTASIFDDLSVAENLWLATYSTRTGRRAANAAVPALLKQFELEPFAADSAGSLPHGRQQWLEIAMVAARRPSLLLLDEPTAGMTRDEATRTADLVTRLSKHSTVVVIEHDMHLVRELDPKITVLHLGKVLARGSLGELEKSDDVRSIYLGGGHAHA